jgi:hypothetical protein
VPWGARMPQFTEEKFDCWGLDETISEMMEFEDEELDEMIAEMDSHLLE